MAERRISQNPYCPKLYWNDEDKFIHHLRETLKDHPEYFADEAFMPMLKDKGDPMQHFKSP